MLELKSIKKTYETKFFKQAALNGVSLMFRKNEFVAILGPSGSGKTTLLNIVGGLDHFDSGDIIVNGKSTKKFKNKDWDAYRNTCIGFIFQSYNLITHISVLSNVEMGMTLAGVNAKKRKKRALEALERVGLSDHAYKKPNQLSGGQMQRVAIARALVNDPDIILADEPTGALDSKTSAEVMNLIKEISEDKLVIMVTHNKDLADEYASRVIELKDGEVEKDSRPVKEENEKNEKFSIRKVAMSFLTALKLSANNIRTKKGRTLITAFASSIGIIGIALILSLSNGFDIQIKNFEKDSLSSLPIMISEQAMQLDNETMQQMAEHNNNKEKEYPDALEIYPETPMREQMSHTNILNKEYVDYIKAIDESLISGLSFQGATNLNVVTKDKEGKYIQASNVFGHLPQKVGNKDKYEFMENTFDLVYGEYPKAKEDLILIIDNKNYVTTDILEAIGLDSTKESISFEEIVGKEFKLISNDKFYKSMDKIYILNTDLEKLYNETSSVTLKISGIVRGKKDKEMITSFSSGIGYNQELIDYIIKQNKNSKIVKAQENANYNVMSGETFKNGPEGEKSKENTLAYLGAESTPYYIQVFSKDFNTKEKVLEYLDKYNEGKETEDKIVYSDMGAMISSLSGSIMDGVTIVLVAFSAISLIVSSIMIGIITYISVLERTKEIGILRALGARKKDISRVFNAETFIIGTASGLLGVGIAYALTFPMNRIILNLTDLSNVAKLNPLHALMLIVISLILTLIGGFIPAKIASKKDPVEALRTE